MLPTLTLTQWNLFFKSFTVINNSRNINLYLIDFLNLLHSIIIIEILWLRN